MSFSKSSRNIELNGTTLTAKCKDRNGHECDSTIEINNYVANVNGGLQWQPHGNFHASSKSVRIEGAELKCESKDRGGSWRNTEINLDEKISNFNGKLIYTFERAIIKVDGNNAKEVANYLKDIYSEHKAEVSTQVAEGPDYKVLYVSTSAGKDEGVILQVSAEAQASIFHVAGEGSGIETVGVEVLQTKAKAWASQAGAGIGLSANLVDVKASAFDLTLGVGIDTGAGIQDDSFTVKALGCGFSVGRKVGISVFGSSFGVDFGRCSLQ